MLLSLNVLPSFSATITCASNLTPEQCLAYLEEQAAIIAKQKKDLNNKLNSELQNQNTLIGRINILSSQISQTEIEIQDINIDIETKNTEITILMKDIDTLEDKISTSTQEISKLENSISKRISESYKFSFMTPIEMFLQNGNLDDIVRKSKYLMDTRKKDKELLQEMQSKKQSLGEEEQSLTEKTLSVQNKRKEIEDNKTELITQKENLAQQQTEQNNLYILSKQNQAEYQAEMSSLKKDEDALTKQITKMIMDLYNQGLIPVNTPVKKGDILGFQGHSGFAAGSHLHFELNFGQTNPFNGYFSGGGIYQMIYSNSARVPIDNAILTQGGHSGGYGGPNAIDMANTSFNAGDRYFLAKPISCLGWTINTGWYSLTGEGAPVRAIKDGKVSAVQTDICGGKYIIVKHNDGDTSLYLHLR